MIFILLLFTHMKMKKVLLGAFLGMFTLAGVAVLPNYADAQSSSKFTHQQDGALWSRDEQDTSYNPGVRGSKTFQGDKLMWVIRSGINWVLGILSFIALCLCLWGGFQMMTSGGDSKKYEGGLNILKWAAIGLWVIAVSWLIVSLIFYVINWSLWTGGENSGTTANVPAK